MGSVQSLSFALPGHRRLKTFSRTMVTAGKKKEYLCIMPDRPHVLDLRRKVKGGRYEGIQSLIVSGKLIDGGAIFTEHPQESEDAQILGSVVVSTGESAEEVRQIINNDIYVNNRVGDLEKSKFIHMCLLSKNHLHNLVV